MTGRRKGRRICGWIMSAAMAFAVWGLIAAGIFDKGIYNTSLLNESISSSSFLEQRYDGFETEVQEAALPEMEQEQRQEQEQERKENAPAASAYERKAQESLQEAREKIGELLKSLEAV